MSALSIQPTYPIFTDIDGQPLEAGYVWIGTANLDPQTNPINVYWDAALTILAPQPIRTLAGYPSNNGTPARLYVGSDYSIRVMNRNGSTVYSAPAATERYSGVVIEVDASDVLYSPPFAGAVETDQQEFNSRYISVFDFMSALEIADVKARTSGFDVTLAIQTAVTYAVSEKAKLYFPAGTYLVTDTINLPIGAQLVGETGFQLVRSFGVDPKATTINFQPTTLKSLFVCSGTSHSNFRFHYSIEGFYLRGNSTDASGNSNYALELRGSIYARYENIGIEQFRTGILCDRTINNRFCNIYTTGKVQAVLYAGNNETTDVWEQCSFQQSPIGVQTAGSSIGVRFSNSLFEQLDTYGVNLTKETQNFTFENCYAEDVCFGGAATSAMFRVGFDGTTAAGPTQLTVIGGLYAGRNAGTVGAFLTCDVINGVVIVSPDVRRFTTGILTSASTSDNTIVVQGFVAQSVTTVVTDIIKIAGIYPTGVFSGANKNQQRGIFGLVTTPIIRGNTTGTGAISLDATNVSAAKAGGALTPFTDNDVGLGSVSLRWAQLFAGTSVINTSDEREKQDIAALNDAEKRVALALKGLVKKFRFKDAVQAKGDAARIHIGVIAQEVKLAFEAEGLDAHRYGIFCSDELENGDTRLGVRYEELLVFIVGAM